MTTQKKSSKSKVKSDKDPEKTVAAQPKENQKEQPVQEEKQFDFGGIPDRNLKKNLGCG